MKKRLPYSIIILAGITFFSCNDWNEYRVESDFEPFVTRFEYEANLRGHTFSFRSSGLIVEFGKLDKGVAGLCHDGNPVRIEIDENYWRKMGNYGGAELIREELIFHEMGHGILGRKHLNKTLSNGEWKSIMCGGEMQQNRTWNVNYRGQRREYYLDELFFESTAEPSFFTTPPAVHTDEYLTVLSDNFDNAATSIWKPGNFANSTTSVENGMLVCRSKSAVNLAILTEIPQLNIQSDFILEYTFQYKGEADSAKYGVAFGTTTSDNALSESVDFFVINNQKKLFTGNTTWYSYFTQVNRNQIIPRGFNRLKIIREGGMTSCFINDMFAYATEAENRQPGSGIGFMVPAGQTLYVDDFRLLKRVTGTAVPRVRMPVTGKLNFIPVESIIHEANNN